MNRKWVVTTIAVLVASLLQAGLAPYLAIGGVVPNLLLIVVVTVALIEGPGSGAAAGFAAGLIFDLLGTGPVGPMALVLTTTGYLAGLLHEQMFAEGWLLPLTVLAIASLLSEVAYGVMLIALGEGGTFWASMAGKMLPAAVYNVALAVLIYPWLARFLRRERPVTTLRRLA
jgi:rod shape-determining protein MreD